MTKLHFSFIYLLNFFTIFEITYSHGILSKFLVSNPLVPVTHSDNSNLGVPNESTKNKNNAFINIDDDTSLSSICKILKGNDERNSSEFLVHTPGLIGTVIFYTYLPVAYGETCFSVKVRAEKYAYLALSEHPHKQGRLYDIILGMPGSITQSAIRKNLVEEVVRVPTPGIINNKEFHEITISWDNGVIKALYGSNLQQFLYYHEPNMYPVNYIGIATFGLPGSWIINEKSCSTLKKSVSINPKKVVTECTLPSKENKEPKFNNLIQLQKYYINRLNEDYEQFNTTVQHSNNKEYIKIFKNELKETYDKAKQIHDEIIIDKIKNGHEIPINIFNEAEKMYEQVRRLFFHYYGNLTNFLESKSVKKDNNDNDVEKLNLLSPVEEFYQIAFGCFTFKVHRSAGKIRVTLTNGYKKTLKALIIIDKDVEIEIMNNFQVFENYKISGPIFNNTEEEYKNYWISWNAQRILIGKDTDTDGFMSTQNQLDFTEIEYVNVFAENGGGWEMKESQCPHDIDIRIDT